MSRKYEKHWAGQEALMSIPGVGIVLDAGASVPSDAAVGYAPGAIFIKTSGTVNANLYQNQGSSTSADFDALVPVGGTSSAATITTGTIGTLVNVTGTRSAGAATDTYKANTAAALTMTDATTGFFVIDTRNTLKNISTVTITGVPVTVASEGATHLNPSLNLAAKTITYTGTTTTTAHNGAMLYVGVPTFTDASACTLSVASSVFINAVAAAGGMLTITASYMIHTSVSGCFLTNAGVWTDMACWESGKEFVKRGVDTAADAVGAVMDKLVPATWRYKAMTELPAVDEDGNETIHRTPINDRGRDRVGIVYDDLPDALRCPGEEKAVSPGVLASFALAALKTLWDRNAALEARLAALEAA